ncbi:LysR substrate-binding domain-containing protein [Pelagibacterium halotolerans]|uniref:Glycine cleavage system transcriptional activator n=1 Tax=Pelagibacterium halotolerans (strain DSM 22347 / JCM 15775 / CGMCC 1.7692 / B2) TaxID=1082931 RepID=G4RD34_PELHB|nr:LysR substrate-binding domain-containing protein [Pelagibacterium halotolerans]AEQ53784.1 glycine cleavage system transcriptional activator [Pelagibacterium halotolerans B2]QJR20057.1 LysR family transcriptional regulator [Pelagibacterium halotolerans]SEA80950.1 LysR family transcriptional regulator, glycine cleavage system transcriptional activator [Pelagibacterium halotolerans]
MQGPSIRMLPLNALRVFWVVIRKGSFRSAADDMLVTPQAVSQQIKLLEDILNVPLFERKGRVIEPTEQAILLSHFVQAGFDEFAEGVRRVTNATYRNRINLNVSPYFATRYLISRLGNIQEAVPGADLRLTTMVDLPDFAADEVDVSIQWGFDTWKEYDTSLLVRDPKIICCSPALAEKIRQPSDLSNMTLLHPVLSRDLWLKVLNHLGVEYHDPERVIEFQDAATMRRGTISGIGVGLISKIDALDDLQMGKLVAPFGVHALQDMDEKDTPGFYLILPKAHRRVKTIAAFCNWIVSQDWD